MEGITSTAYNRAKGYWKRRGYQRLNGWRSSRRRRMPIVELGAESSGSNSSREQHQQQRRFWRIKLTPRVKLKFRFSPKKFLLRLRDAYVNFMTRMASSRFINSGITGYGGYGDGVNGFGALPLKEYDERMIIQIYKSLVVAQSQLVTPAARVPPPRIDPPLATIAEC